MKIAFYIGKQKSGTFYDKLICLVTRSKYSHCEIVFDDGYSASSSPRDGGIRFKKIVFDDNWDIFDLRSDVNENVIKEWFKANDNDTYDLIGAIGSVFNLDFTSEDKKFCSQACAIVFGFNPITTPEKLFRQLINERMIQC